MSALPITEQTTVIEGYVYDVHTGECLGPVTPKPQWVCDSPEKAEWVLEKLQTVDTEIAALEARKVALTKNIDTMIREQQQRRDSLLFRFQADLTEVGRQSLPAGKKTWTCPYGSVGFRSVGASVKVVDEEKALIAAATAFPEAIKTTTSLLVSKIPEDTKAQIMDDPHMAARLGFDVVPARESVTIKTGVGE
jgi:hypothetical protein